MKRIIIGLVVLASANLVFVSLWADSKGEHLKMAETEENYGICPVMGKPAVKEYSYTYQGKTYYFCCPECVEKFKDNPEPYIVKSTKEPVAGDSSQSYFSGKMVNGVREVKIETFQYGFFPDSIVVSKGDTVRLLATSTDVTHGIYIADFGVNEKILKGEITTIEFKADKAGEFDIVCSSYCGSRHSQMKGKLIIKSEE